MLNMQPEIVQELVKKYIEQVKKLEDCNQRFKRADADFSSWTGPTRQELQERMKNDTPAFNELINVVLSYGTTAQASANRAIEVEKQLTSMLG